MLTSCVTKECLKAVPLSIVKKSRDTKIIGEAPTTLPLVLTFSQTSILQTPPHPGLGFILPAWCAAASSARTP